MNPIPTSPAGGGAGTIPAGLGRQVVRRAGDAIMRCARCGHEANETDKFCAECGVFLREAQTERRILLALAEEQRGDHRAARARIAEYRAQFERGQMREDAEVLDLKAMCASGKIDAARRAAREFLRKNPGSLAADTVDDICGPNQAD